MGAICSFETSVTFTGLHGVISQMIELFITTVVRTSNPTQQFKMIVFPLFQIQDHSVKFSKMHLLHLLPPHDHKTEPGKQGLMIQWTDADHDPDIAVYFHGVSRELAWMSHVNQKISFCILLIPKQLQK
jgi:hypothetical protein